MTARTPVDLRSDTVTRPTAGMREAMASAVVGDDVYGDDPTVIELERRVAELAGTEASLFTVSGTMANQLAIRVHAAQGDEMYAHRDSHIVSQEAGAASALWGVVTRALDGEAGVIDPQTLAAAMPAEPHRPAPAAAAPALPREHLHDGRRRRRRGRRARAESRPRRAGTGSPSTSTAPAS